VYSLLAAGGDGLQDYTDPQQFLVHKVEEEEDGSGEQVTDVWIYI